jgi:uncharacterized membrane protein SpoIIM required for sporulation
MPADILTHATGVVKATAMESPPSPAQWERLSELVERASSLRGLRGLREADLIEFGRLYRRAAAELSHARSHGTDSSQLEYLNWLVGRAYALLYVSDSRGLSSVPRFFTHELPQTIRRHAGTMALATALFLGPALVMALLTLLRPDLLEMVNPQMAGMIRELAARHHERNWMPEEIRPMASSLIMANNIQVSFFAFSGGILLGLGTLYVLVSNGLVLGAIFAGVARTSAAADFFAFVAPHGVIELPAIVISAGAGLLLARALIDPGLYSRADALRLAGREAAVLILGVASFLVVAGTVEGLFSPSAAPHLAKFVVAAMLAAAFWSYLLLAGRERPPQMDADRGVESRR